MSTDLNLTPQEKHAANHMMKFAFTDWCDRGDQADYVDLARRLNAAAIKAVQVVRAHGDRDSA